MTLRINATCIGPSTAEDPNRETDPAISTMRVISGTIASIYDGSLVLFDVIGCSAISFVFQHSTVSWGSEDSAHQVACWLSSIAHPSGSSLRPTPCIVGQPPAAG